MNIFHAIAAAAIALAAWSSTALAQDPPPLTEIKLGVVGEHNDEWLDVAERLRSRGIELTLVKFSDYSLPNAALAEGEIDLNAFQHTAFLSNDIASRGYRLTAVHETFIVPLSAYSTKIRSVEELGDGDLIAIASDPVNAGRALKALDVAGIIRVDPDRGYVPDVSDILDNPRHLRFYQVEAANIPGILPDVAMGFINAHYAIDHGLNPATDAIFSDTAGGAYAGNPFINVVAARTEDADRPEFRTIFEVYDTRRTADIIIRQYHNVAVPVFSYEH